MMRARRLAGRIAVVTGAARGIGRAVAQAFAADGALVQALDVEAAELETLAACSGGAIAAWPLDLADAAAVETTFAAIEDRAGPVAVLVNNAGIIARGPVEAITVETWDRMMAVNLRAAFLCVRAVTPGMKVRRRGAIINVSSNAGLRGLPEESAYTATKFGLEGFSRALAAELAPYGISVNTITPGHPVRTAMSETTYGPAERAVWKDPSELAPAFVHLALQDATGLNDRHVRAWELVQQLQAKEAAG